MALGIDCHVIDPAAHIAKRNLGFELQGRLSRLSTSVTSRKD
jgi:hypothetical protein